MLRNAGYYIASLLFSFLLTFCHGQEEIKLNGLGSLDLSRDDKDIVFSYFKNDYSSIYVCKLYGDSIFELISSSKDTSFVKPKFSPSGDQILFIAFSSDKRKSNLFTIGNNGKNKRQITFQEDLITDAAFSYNGHDVFYVKANSFENYSPMSRKAPHQMDIYKVDLTTLEESRITDFEAYGIYNLTAISDDHLLVRLEGNGKVGMYLIELNKSKEIRPIHPANNPRGNVDLYYDPSYSEKFNVLAFSAPYELYIMSMDDQEAKLIYGPKNDGISNIENVIVMRTTKRILFKKQTEKNAFRVVDFDGSNLTMVRINVDNSK